MTNKIQVSDAIPVKGGALVISYTTSAGTSTRRGRAVARAASPAAWASAAKSRAWAGLCAFSSFLPHPRSPSSFFKPPNPPQRVCTPAIAAALFPGRLSGISPLLQRRRSFRRNSDVHQTRLPLHAAAAAAAAAHLPYRFRCCRHSSNPCSSAGTHGRHAGGRQARAEGRFASEGAQAGSPKPSAHLPNPSARRCPAGPPTALLPALCSARRPREWRRRRKRRSTRLRR